MILLLRGGDANPSGGLIWRGGARDTRSLGRKFIIFMQFLGKKIDKIVIWRLPGGWRLRAENPGSQYFTKISEECQI